MMNSSLRAEGEAIQPMRHGRGIALLRRRRGATGLFRRLFLLAIAIIFPCALSACGYKGSLKSPSQIASQEAKKARKSAQENKPQQPISPAPATPIVQSPVADQPPEQQPSMQSEEAMPAPMPGKTPPR